MKFRKTIAKTAARDLRAFADHLDTPDGTGLRKAAADMLNTKLDELLGENAFGTEGQRDPRGDHRE